MKNKKCFILSRPENRALQAAETIGGRSSIPAVGTPGLKPGGSIKKYGFTLAEALVVVAIFTSLFAILANIFLQSNNAWQIGRNRQIIQQEARKALDRITRDLRVSNFNWQTDSGNCSLIINQDGTQIDFCVPVFNESGNVTSLTAVRYYFSHDNPDRLLRRTGSTDQVVAVNLDNSINQRPYFDLVTSANSSVSCGCSRGLACPDSFADNCVVKIKIPVVKNVHSFNATTAVALRNREASLGGIEVSLIQEEQ